MAVTGSRTVLSRSHVPSMTGGCTCPIYYQVVVSLEKGSVIIRYKLPELSKKFLRRRTPLSRNHVSSMTRAGSRTASSRCHVSSTPGEWTYPIYYQTVVSVDKGSVIIRHKLPERIKILRRPTPRSRSHISSMTRAGSRTLLSRSHVSSLTGECTYLTYDCQWWEWNVHHLVDGECIT